MSRLELGRLCPSALGWGANRIRRVGDGRVGVQLGRTGSGALSAGLVTYMFILKGAFGPGRHTVWPSRHASRVALRGAAEAAHLRVQRASSFGGGRLELGYSNARARRYPVAHAPLNGVPKMCPGQLGAGSVATGATVVRFDRRPACTVNRFPGDRNWPRAVYWGIFQSRFSFNRAAVGRGSRLCRRRNLDCNLLPQLRKLTPDNLRSITC